MKHNRLAKIQCIFAAIVFGTISIFVRNISVGSGQLALYRAILAATLLCVYFIITKKKISIREMGKEGLLLLLSGGAMGFNWIFLFEAYKYTSVSVATLSYYFAPVIVTILCPLIFKEKLTIKQIICFIMSTLGVVLIINVGQLGEGKENLIGIGCGLLAAVFYATVILTNKFIKKVDGIERTFFQFLAAIIVLVPYVLLTEELVIGQLDGFGWLNLLIVGLFHTGVTYCLYFSAIKELPGQEVAVLSYIDPLVAIIVSVTILGESIFPIQILGGVLILGFTLWNELGEK